MNKIQLLRIVMIITGCLLLIGCADQNGKYSVTYENGSKMDFNEIPAERKLNYYQTIDEAIVANEFDGTDHVTNIKKIIKILKKNEDCLAFFITEIDGQDTLVTYKLRMKEENGTTYYSTPCFSMIRAWKLDKKMIKSILKCPTNTETLVEKVDSDLSLNNYTETFNIGSPADTVAWGLWNSELINKLKISGVSPTEIIKLQMDGDTVYFWYYANLEVDLSNLDKSKITVE